MVDIQRLLVGAENDAVGERHVLPVLRDDALRAGVEDAAVARAGDGEVHAAVGVGREIVDHAADAFKRLAVERVREHPALRLELLDAAAESAFGDKQRAVLAARDGARGVDVAVGDLREAGRRIELDDVARVVVREQHRAVLAGDRAVDVVALPRPDDLPALYRLQHSGNRRRRRQHRLRRRSGGSRRVARARNRERLRRVLALRERRLVVGVLPRLLTAAAIERRRRTLIARVFVSFRANVPVAVRAELALVADEHRRRFLVVLELPEQPVRRDVRIFAAARVIHGGGVARAVAGAVERRHVLEQLECRERRGREEVAFGAVDQQHGTVDLLQRVLVRLRPGALHAGVEDADGLHARVRAQRDGEKSSARLPHHGDVLEIDFAFERRAVARVFFLRPRDRFAQIVGVLLPRAAPGSGTLPITRKPCDAIVVKKPE